MAQLNTADAMRLDKRRAKIKSLESEYEDLLDLIIDNAPERTTENLAKLRHIECQIEQIREGMSYANTDVYTTNISIIK